MSDRFHTLMKRLDDVLGTQDHIIRLLTNTEKKVECKKPKRSFRHYADQIVEILTDGRKWSVFQIKEELIARGYVPSLSGVKSSLSILMSSGQINRVQHGHYQIASKGENA